MAADMPPHLKLGPITPFTGSCRLNAPRAGVYGLAIFVQQADGALPPQRSQQTVTNDESGLVVLTTRLIEATTVTGRQGSINTYRALPDGLHLVAQQPAVTQLEWRPNGEPLILPAEVTQGQKWEVNAMATVMLNGEPHMRRRQMLFSVLGTRSMGFDTVAGAAPLLIINESIILRDEHDQPQLMTVYRRHMLAFEGREVLRGVSIYKPKPTPQPGADSLAAFGDWS